MNSQKALQMKLNLPESIHTMQDLASVQREIQAYSKWFAHESIKKRTQAKRQHDTPDLSPAAEELLGDWTDKNAITQKQIDLLIAEMTDYRHRSKIITITLAGPPPTDVKKKLVVWCRKNISQNVLVNFDFNRTLLGGLVVRFDSQIYDWSFRRQIMTNQQKFPEVLRNV